MFASKMMMACLLVAVPLLVDGAGHVATMRPTKAAKASKAPKASKAAHVHTTAAAAEAKMTGAATTRAAKASKAPKASKAAHMHTTGAAKEGKDAGKGKGGKDAKGNKKGKHDGHNHGDDAENKMSGSGSGDAAAFMSSDSDIQTSHIAGGAMFAVAGVLIAVGVAIKAGRDRRTAGYTQVDGNVAPLTEVKSSTPLLI